MKTAVAVAVSALLYGMAYAADERMDNQAAEDSASAIEVSTFEVAPGTARGPLNNGLFNTHDTYGHILSDPDLFRGPEQVVTETEAAPAIEVSAFEGQPGTERGPLNNGMFSNRETYGSILADPDLFLRRERVVTEPTEPASAIEISTFEVAPSMERGPLNNGQFDNHDTYGYILADPRLFGK